MQVQLDYNVESYTIRSYAPGQITVSLPLSETLARDPEMGRDLMEERQLETRELTHSCVVSPAELIEQWKVSTVASLSIADFQPILALDPEIIVLGTGDEQIFPPANVIAALNRQRVGLEVMNTAAACRTYNFLMADGRRVACALFMIQAN